MGKKWVLTPYAASTNADLSANAESDPVNVQRLDRIALQIMTSGTPTGTLTIQTSNNYNLYPNVVPTWIDMPINLQALAGTANNYFVDMLVTGIVWIKVVFTAGGGSSGNMDVLISAKES